jgi:hypothetical protein
MVKGGIAFLFFLLLSLIPSELYFQIGGVRFEAYRLFLLIYTVFNIQNILNTRFEKFERWIFFFCGWSLISFVAVHGISGIQSGVIRFLEVGVVYYIGRDFCLNGGAFAVRYILLSVSIAFLLMVPLALQESKDGIRVTHVIAADLAGTYAEAFIGDNYFRHGVYRSSVVFSHPILYSVIAMSLIVMTWYVFSGVVRYLFIFGYLVAAYASMTSAGFIMLAMQIGLIILDRLNMYIPGIRKSVVRLTILVLVGLQLFTTQGAIKLLLNVLALNPETAFARYYQWENAWDDVMRNKIFGIGFNEWTRPWWMPDSIDSYWLHMAVVHGLVGVSIIATFWVLLFKYLFSSYQVSKDRLIFVMSCAVLGIIFGGITVAFFDRAQTFTYLFLGMMTGYTYKRMAVIYSREQTVNGPNNSVERLRNYA